MRILEADGPAVTVRAGEERYVRHKPRHVARLIPRRVNTADTAAMDTAASNFAATDIAATDNAATDIAATGFAATDITATNFAATDIAATDNAATDNAATGFAATDNAATGFTATDIASTGFAATDTAATDFAATDTAATDNAATGFAATDIAAAVNAGFVTAAVTVHGSENAPSAPKRRLPKFRIIVIITGAAALLCMAALVFMRSGLNTRAAFGAVTRVNVIDAGVKRLVFTKAKTAGEVLGLLGIEPDGDDYINVSADTPVTPDMTLEYHTVEYSEYIIDEVLFHRTQTEELQTIPRGETQVIRSGIDGSLYREVRAEYRDGELYEEVILEEKYAAPSDELVRVGVGGKLAGRDGKEYNYSYYIDVDATAYVAEGVTYTGKEARDGIVAVDPDVIPLGTVLYVKGDYGDYGVCTADDIGGGIVGNRIDICMEGELSKLFEFGIRPMRVYILED